MPGISFLFKKPWHPQTLENQKKLFIAESRDSDRQRREEEAAAEVAREAELQRYDAAGDLRERDARTSSLRFMYCPPKKEGEGDDKPIAHGLLPPSVATRTDASGEDPAVKNFWKKMRGESVESSSTSQFSDSESHGAESGRRRGAGSVPTGTRLEQLVGKAAEQHTTREEMEARHPRLKNAPVEDAFVRNLDVKYKPFNDVIRNVRCVRCGTWGHSIGDRECPLAGELNPYDLARLRKEDPIQFARSDAVLQEKQKLILKTASRSSRGDPTRLLNGKPAHDLPENQQLVAWDSGSDSDPESEFLATLSTREKKLLLIKLKQLEEGGAPGTTGEKASRITRGREENRPKRRKRSRSSSSSSSSNNSSSSSGSSTTSSSSSVGSRRVKRGGN